MFAAIFDRHYDAIARYLRRRVGATLGDELASETFLRAFAGRADFDPSRTSALPWLYGIAANLVRQHHRTEQRRLRAYARAVVRLREESDLADVDERLDAAAAGGALAAALAELNMPEREVLLLYAWAELSYQEIAAALRIRPGTVRSRLHRGRAAIQEQLRRIDGRRDEPIRTISTRAAVSEKGTT
jgi:RNA polymerase sigma-70 factor (ECF subfamily)